MIVQTSRYNKKFQMWASKAGSYFLHWWFLGSDVCLGDVNSIHFHAVRSR